MQYLKYLFSPDHAQFRGIRPVNIYLMRMLYLLMFFVLGKDVWSVILAHEGAWEPHEAMSWSVWAAFSMLALLGFFKTVEMIPILLLEIVYKSLWLWMVAYPLMQQDQLAGSNAEGMTMAFLWVLLPVVILPWGYVFDTYLRGKSIRSRTIRGKSLA